MNVAALSAYFPALTDILSKQTSDPDSRYNCIAWAFGDNGRWWWPARAYWPMQPAPASAMQAFEALFARDGWMATTSTDLEDGFMKIALYAMAGNPTHAARQLPTGLWTSKLGKSLDLSHELWELEGPKYGQVHKIFHRHA
jgi:hypothetical protein